MSTMDLNPGERRLEGGNVSTAVCAGGQHRASPKRNPWSRSVGAFLSHLNSVGYVGAPQTHGFEELGRHVLEYIEGNALMPFEPRDHHAAAHQSGPGTGGHKLNSPLADRGATPVFGARIGDRFGECPQVSDRVDDAVLPLAER